MRDGELSQGKRGTFPRQNCANVSPVSGSVELPLTNFSTNSLPSVHTHRHRHTHTHTHT